ncbi:MAG: hypothetical protein ACI8WB_005456, partial [Phenylobacterium sp.]
PVEIQTPLVERFEDYPWSSYLMYVSSREPQPNLPIDEVVDFVAESYGSSY